MFKKSIIKEEEGGAMGIGSAMVERECSTECVCVNETQKLKQVKGKETYCSASLR